MKSITSEPGVRVCLLGPVEVVADGLRRPVSGARRKTVLAAIALCGATPIGVRDLIGTAWDGPPPPTAVNTLRSHVSHLRRLSECRDAIVASPGGYSLNREIVTTDAVIAEQSIRDAALMPAPAQRAERLRAALSLWRGEALSDTAGGPWLRAQAQRLDNLRIDALEAFMEARLALGEHPRLVAELEVLTGRYPFREKFGGQLMLALYRCGRQAEALATYQRLRMRVRKELGIEPSPTLRDLEVAILRQDAKLDQPETSGAQVQVRPASSAPAQLPPVMPAIAGRAAELAHHLDVLAELDNAATRTPRIIAVTGAASVGKTALVVQWAHSAAHLFPDGQLYVDLRGFDPGGSALSPGQAVRAFLNALGTPDKQIPDTVESQTGLFRSIVAGKRLLIIIDNARDEDHVRPLLPGTPTCVSVIASRSQLAGLAAAEGAHLVPLNHVAAPMTIAETGFQWRASERL